MSAGLTWTATIGCGSASRSDGTTRSCATWTARACSRTVNYDSTPFRLVLAAQNSTVMAGVRGSRGISGHGRAALRCDDTGGGPVHCGPVPIVGSFRGLLVGGFDYCARRTQLSGDGIDTLYSTPAVAPYIGVVLEVGSTLRGFVGASLHRGP